MPTDSNARGLSALAGFGLVLRGTHLLSRFQPRERVWQSSVDKARMVALINLGLCPFIYWWNRHPSEVFFEVMADLLGLGFLFATDHQDAGGTNQVCRDEDGNDDGQVRFAFGFLLKERALRVRGVRSAHVICWLAVWCWLAEAGHSSAKFLVKSSKYFLFHHAAKFFCSIVPARGPIRGAISRNTAITGAMQLLDRLSKHFTPVAVVTE